MASASIGNGPAALWYRVHAVSADSMGGTAAVDYAAVLPAALNAARHRRSFIVGWLSRGGGAPLELITNAGPLSPGDHAADAEDPLHAADDGAGGADLADHAGPDAVAAVEMLFPWGARGAVIGANMITELDRLVWAACPGRVVPVSPDAPARPGLADDGRPPTLFESALQTLMGRPFGWLVVADPTELIDDEIAELRSQLTVLRRYEDEQARFEATRTEQRLAELDTYREAGLWHVRVLVGAATERDLALIAPVLVGSVDLGAHPYRRTRCPADRPGGRVSGALRGDRRSARRGDRPAAA
jgi:hypothetical protein